MLVLLLQDANSCFNLQSQELLAVALLGRPSHFQGMKW
jgi:hypothetical protein